MKSLLFSSKLNLLLLFFPAAVVAKAAGASPAVVFFFSLAALCPLAERIAYITDEAAKYTNDTLGGLLSATMGNATEMIVRFFACEHSTSQQPPAVPLQARRLEGTATN
jgi:Ca2+:H+ antiporter